MPKKIFFRPAYPFGDVKKIFFRPAYPFGDVKKIFFRLTYPPIAREGTAHSQPLPPPRARKRRIFFWQKSLTMSTYSSSLSR